MGHCQPVTGAVVVYAGGILNAQHDLTINVTSTVLCPVRKPVAPFMVAAQDYPLPSTFVALGGALRWCSSQLYLFVLCAPWRRGC